MTLIWGPSCIISHKDKYQIGITLKTFFWAIYKGNTWITGGVGKTLEEAKNLACKAVYKVIAEENMKKGSYPPGVPNSGGG